MEVVDECEVPRIGGVDFIVCRHFHPFFKVGQNRDTLHGGRDGWCDGSDFPTLNILFAPIRLGSRGLWAVARGALVIVESSDR